MIERQQWVDHEFNLGIDIGWTENVMSRIRDTHIRIKHHCQDLSNEQLSQKVNGAWSIKEHIGHLTDLEELWIGRFNEFSKELLELSMADMSNQKTKTSNHNELAIDILLEEFTQERNKLIQVYENLSQKSQEHQAMHPRIKMLMRPVDLLFFVAEHDDHHIVSITKLLGNN